MSWLLFCDESGHDHTNTPMEVRGGIAIHSSGIWEFITDFRTRQQKAFGLETHEFKDEIKGSKLLKSKRFEWADQERVLEDNERYNGVRRFLSKSATTRKSKRDFTAYGQASLLLVDGIFDLLEKHEAKLFASCIPRGIKPPKDFKLGHFLRKDHIFLQERFFWFLEGKQEVGLLVMDQTEKTEDRRFINRLERYYTKTQNGRRRAKWIVPSPIFVDSGLSPLIQAADVCIYCVNWGFRRPQWRYSGPMREEIHKRYAGRCGAIQFRGDMLDNDSRDVRRAYGIFYVNNPFPDTST